MLAVKQVEMPQTSSDKDNELQSSVVAALHFEIETLKDLDHANIVQFLGQEQTPQYLSIFLEYVCLYQAQQIQNLSMLLLTGSRWQCRSLHPKAWQIRKRGRAVLYCPDLIGSLLPARQRCITSRSEGRQYTGRPRRQLQDLRLWH